LSWRSCRQLAEADTLEGRAIEEYRRWRKVAGALADAVRRAEALERLELTLRRAAADSPIRQV
jgi:hypothetical protein